MASQNVYSVTLDEAIEAMRLTAADMSVKYKETSLSVSTQVALLFFCVDSECFLQGLAVRHTIHCIVNSILTCMFTAYG